MACVELDRSFIELDGFVVFFGIRVGKSEVVMGIDIAGSKLNCAQSSLH